MKKVTLGFVVIAAYAMASMSFAADKAAISDMSLVQESGNVAAAAADGDFHHHHHHHEHHHHHHWSKAPTAKAVAAPSVNLNS